MVRERKRIQIVDYRGSKALTKTTIEDELKKKDATIKLDTFYDHGRARRVETIIREMLRGQGAALRDGATRDQDLGGAGLQVSFIIDDGPKAKLKEITFTATPSSPTNLRGDDEEARAHRASGT